MLDCGDVVMQLIGLLLSFRESVREGVQVVRTELGVEGLLQQTVGGRDVPELFLDRSVLATETLESLGFILMEESGVEKISLNGGVITKKKPPPA